MNYLVIQVFVFFPLFLAGRYLHSPFATACGLILAAGISGYMWSEPTFKAIFEVKGSPWYEIGYTCELLMWLSPVVIFMCFIVSIMFFGMIPFLYIEENFQTILFFGSLFGYIVSTFGALAAISFPKNYGIDLLRVFFGVIYNSLCCLALLHFVVLPSASIYISLLF